ncbi:MAG: fumarylacetoacetate hydrolase family protein [Parvularculaceae bacterium]
MNAVSQTLAFAAPPAVRVPVADGRFFPVRRIFCVGRNYADHVAEMGGDARADPPVYFTKPADALVFGPRAAYPPKTDDLHFEGELALCLGPGAERIADAASARAAVFGLAAACDLTRRDLQKAAKAAGGPWDMAKGFDASAPLAPIAPGAAALDDAAARLRTRVNGEVRQDAALAEMIWEPTEILVDLSSYVALAAGDVVLTGTPAGVGPLSAGDAVAVDVDGLPSLWFEVVGGR